MRLVYLVELLLAKIPKRFGLKRTLNWYRLPPTLVTG
nr:MAG TPA: hypothetical protein [Caudoviricetes sp.]